MRERSFSARVPERVACVWLPQFAVRAERARRPDLDGRPLVLVVQPEKGEAVIRACSPEGAAAGLSPGMPAHAVSQRCPGAALLPFDDYSYQRLYEALLGRLDHLTPQVEAQPLEAFYLDLSGLPDPAIREPETLAAALRAVIPPPFAPRVGIASGKFTAWVAANTSSPVRPLAVADEEKAVFLRNAPSSLLPVDGNMARRLDLLGLRTLGRIARLPRSAMLAQFGRPGERAHRLACGEDREPLVPHVSPTLVRETQAFPTAAPTAAHFYLALYQLLERAWRRPERRGRGVRQVRLQAVLESGEVWERKLTLRRPAEQWEQVFSELRRRLESTGVRPAGAMTELALELTAFAARVDAQRPLIPNERQQRRERLSYELEQLRERLGRPSVYRVVEVEPWSRLPEKRHALLTCDF